MTRWSGQRLVVAAALGAWAAAFWFLFASGRTALYLSTRTSWLVPVGAVLATTAALGRLATARVRAPEPPEASLGLGVTLLVLPVVILLAMPPTTLGSFAVSRRSSFGGVSGVVTPDDFEHGPLTMVHIAAAEGSAEDMARLRARAGESVTFPGFVTRRPETPADEILLTRFVITCCVADATVAQVRVVGVPPGSIADGAWVEVTGRLFPIGDEVLLVASDVVEAQAPDSPYLTAY